MRKFVFYFHLTVAICSVLFLHAEKVFSQTSKVESTSNTANERGTLKDSKPSYAKGITGGRARSLVGGVIGLVSLAIGWNAKRLWTRGNVNGRSLAILALTLGVIAVALSVIHLLNTTDAVFGSGSGKAGAIVAFVPSSIGIAFGWLILKKTNKKNGNL